MKQLDLSGLHSILEAKRGPCVSLYISGGSQGLWAPRTVLKYRKLLKNAEGLLRREYPQENIVRLLEPMRYFSSLEGEFPTAQTLCFFSSPEISGYFPLSQKVDARSVVAESFHVTPIADFINPMRTWFLVKLTKGGLNLYRGRGHALELLREFTIPNHQRVLAGKSQATGDFAGQRYIRFTDEDHLALDDFVSQDINQETSRFPLVLCGTRTDTDHYVRCSIHNYDLTVNFSERYRELDCQSLLDAVWPKVKKHFDLDARLSLACLRHANAAGKTLSTVESVIRHLRAGAVRTLAITLGAPDWGSIDWANGTVHRKLDSLDGHTDCIYDDLAEQAMRQGCKVVFCSPSELPAGQRVLAV